MKTINDLELRVRTYNTLVKLGLTDIPKVKNAFRDGSLLKMPAIGRVSHHDIGQALSGIPFGKRTHYP